MSRMRNALFRLLGWRALVLHGDPAFFDRWLWLRKHLARGPLRTLDAGTGNGAFALYSATLGNHVVGLSFDERDIESERERVRIAGVRPSLRLRRSATARQADSATRRF